MASAGGAWAQDTMDRMSRLWKPKEGEKKDEEEEKEWVRAGGQTGNFVIRRIPGRRLS